MAEDKNREWEQAWRIVNETGANLFLTGKAGTGKTTFLRKLRNRRFEKGRVAGKRCVVVAPTGIAAVNAGGMTIHSFFQLSTSIYLPGVEVQSDVPRRFDRFSKNKLNVIRSMDLLVIDEVSMVRADLLDAVDSSLRRHRDPGKPFGGVQVLLVGDLQQLPPVAKDEEWQLLSRVYATPYFFSSNAYESGRFAMLELKKIYRQNDGHFLEILNRVRDNRADSTVLAELNKRVITDFRPPRGEQYIRLVTHNAQASQINDDELAAIPEPGRTYGARIKGEFAENAYPADSQLMLKRGAQVMCLRNDPDEGYYNGMLAKVDSLHTDGVTVRTDDGRFIHVGACEWENIKYTFDEKSGAIHEKVDGTFSQLPLRLAWAITIHKSQGLTFDRAIIDASHAFAFGQTYVALSRCRELEGIVLSAPLTPAAIQCDPAVINFLHCAARITDSQLDGLRMEFRDAMISEAFGIDDVRRSFDALHSIVSDTFASIYPSLLRQYSLCDMELRDLQEVARKFAVQRGRLAHDPLMLSTRIASAADYFNTALQRLNELVANTPAECGDKASGKRLAERLADLKHTIFVKRHVWTNLGEENLDPQEYMRLKSQAGAVLEMKNGNAVARPNGSVGRTAHSMNAASDEMTHPRLFTALCEWRAQLAKEMEVPAFVINSNKGLAVVAEHCPRTESDLLKLDNWGAQRVRQYGAAVLKIVADYLSKTGQE